MASDPNQKPEPEVERPPLPAADDALYDPYQVLGLSRQATESEIKKAYFAKVREFPPEREPAMFKRIRTAYDALRTPEARASTDLFLLHNPVPYEPYKRPPSFDLSFHETDLYRLRRQNTDLDRDDFQDDFREVEL